ncbi:transducin/WD40 repeat-like superfamily protein [Tanacetum coccineum]
MRMGALSAFAKLFSILARMVQQLLDNFDEDGYNYPCVGGMHMMEFTDPEVARRHAVPESEPEHAMLIVGLDTSSNDHREHHVIVKNSYGKSWGNKGYSKVAIGALTYVCIPVKKIEAELKVQANAEAAKARAKAAEARARAAKRKAKDMGVSMGKGKAKVDGY